MNNSLDFNFYKNFSIMIIKIEEKHINIINEIICLSGNKLTKIYDIELVIRIVQEINLIAFSIYELNKKGINSSNYNTKLKQYQVIGKKLLDEYGVDLNLVNENGEIPFSNPTELYVKIDFLLTILELNQIQRADFFKDFLFRERLPKQSESENMIIKMNELLKYYFEVNGNKEMSKYFEKKSTLEKTQPKFVEFYLNFLNTDLDYHLNNYEFDETSLKNKLSKEYFPIGSWLKKSNLRKKENHFLNYPLYLTTEAETLNKILKTDKYKSNDIYQEEKNIKEKSEFLDKIPF